MKTTYVLFVLALLAPAPAVQAADRLVDRDVKALVERVDSGREQFEDALDNKVKSGVLRGPSGEVNVNKFLDDFEENINRLQSRLSPEYAASAEAGTVLRQATAIDTYFRGQPLGTRGESEWNRLSGDLKTLAVVYGTTFPVPGDATVRRMGDREVAKEADELAKSADRLKKSLDTDLKKDATLDKQGRQAIVDQADQLQKDAKSLRDRVKDGEPSSSESEKVLAQASKLQALIGSRTAPASLGVWSGITPGLKSLAGAYGSTWPAR